MKNKLITALISLAALSSCNDKTTSISLDTFIHGDKVYRIINNKVIEIGDLKSDTIKKAVQIHPKVKNYTNGSLSFLKDGAYTEGSTIYYNGTLYCKLRVKGVGDLDKYNGALTVNLVDKNLFTLTSFTVTPLQFTRILNNDNTANYYIAEKAIEMDPEVANAVNDFDVTSNLVKF